MLKKKPAAAEPVASVAKALASLRSFVDGQDEWGVRELGAELSLPPSTVHRLLARLRIEGFVGFDKNHQKYKVGFEFTRLSAAVMQRHGLRQTALPLMRELTERTGESVWLALFDDEGHRIAYIAESDSPHSSRYIAPLGRTKGLLDSACGLVILAALPAETRKKVLKGLHGQALGNVNDTLRTTVESGYAVMRAGEVGSAMMISAVVEDEDGSPVGSLGIVVPIYRLGTGQEKILGELVRDTAQRLSKRLGAKLLGGASAGTWQDAIGLISALLREHSPSLLITPALGGGGRNMEDVQKGLGAYAMTAASSLHDAREGRGYFKKRHEALRCVMHLSELHFFVIVRGGIDVHNADDLRRLRVSPGEQGFSSAEAFEDILAAASIAAHAKSRRKSGAVLYLDYPEGKRQFEVGNVDALIWMSGFSNPLLGELEISTASQLLPLEKKMIDAMVRLNPGYRRGLLPKTAFPRWLGSDAVTLAVPTALVCRADRPEQEVYEFTRTIYEKRDKLAQLSGIYNRLDADFVLDGLTAPLHPGAERFFKEVGIHPRYASKTRRGN
jgi:TRAP transporter TAXI family solute receptor